MKTIRTVLGNIKRRLTNQYPRPLPRFDRLRSQLQDKHGLEIGGPSLIFSASGQVPVYPLARVIDNCNFSSNTVWEGTIRSAEGFTFDGNKLPGLQYIADGNSLRFIEDKSLDFIISSHCLEHLANPIGALVEWKRIIRDNGLLILVIPDKERTFDHKRPVTPISHMIHDYERSTPESDMTHFDEVTRLHDISRDPGAGSVEGFIERCMDNYAVRCMHHHVFNLNSSIKIVEYAGFEILQSARLFPFHLVLVAKSLHC
jgi:SAM-dependent methyltransferase